MKRPMSRPGGSCPEASPHEFQPSATQSAADPSLVTHRGGSEPQNGPDLLSRLGLWGPLAIAAPLLAHRVLELALFGDDLSPWQLAAAHTLPPAAMAVAALALWRILPPLPAALPRDAAPGCTPSRHGGLAVAAGLLLGTGAALINLLSMLATEGSPGARGAIDPGTAALVLHVAVFAPIAEELAFRGLLYRGLRQITRPLPAAIVAALIFALMHSHLGQSAWAFGLGLLLAFAYEQTRSLLAPILVHALFNAVPVAMAVVRTRPDDFSPIWLALALTGLLFAAAASRASQSFQDRHGAA